MLTVLIAGLIQASQPAPAPDVSWMAGYWLDCSGGREASETWSNPRGGLMVGHSVTLLDDDRASFEVSHIKVTPDGLVYFAQPEGAPPTAFAQIASGANRAKFYSATSDFPSYISYQRDGDRLNARIDGIVDGQPRSIEWNFEAKPINTRCSM